VVLTTTTVLFGRMGDETAPRHLLSLDTVDGVELEAELAAPTVRRAVVVLAHPHPRYGGDMHNGVVAALFESLPRHGIAALRFNFRGTGGSGGDHDEGIAEMLDVAAAVEAAAPFAVDVPLVSIGYSFGADVSLTCTHPRLEAWIAVAPPLGVVRLDAIVAGADHRPKLLLVPEHDQFDPPARAAERTAGWKSTTLLTVPMADHFLGGRLSVVVEECLSFLASLER